MKSFYLWMILVLPAFAAAQDGWKGRVLAEGRPVAGATVACGGAYTTTDREGFFTLRDSGRIHISAIGFEPLTAAMPQRDSIALFHLLMSATSMNEVVVTGTSRAVQRSFSPVAVEVYTPQFFKKNPTPSIFESLQHVNGVRPQINCSVCNTGDIHINGLEGPYTMVTIDGMPIVGGLSSVYGLFGIPNSLIERVEIVKGPASGLYGSEAIGGLINIITKTPEKAPLFTATAMSTSWKEHSLDLGYKWTGRGVQSLLGLHYFNYTNPVDRNNDGFTDATLQHRVSLFNKWSWQRPHNRVAMLGGRLFYEDRWGGEMNWTPAFRGGDSIYGESIDTRRWELMGRYALPLAEKILFTASATGHRQRSFYGTTPYHADQYIVFNQLTWDKPWGKGHQLLAGLAGRYQFYDDNATATVDTASGSNRPDKTLMPGIFVQDEWQLHPRHLLLLGMRYDHHPVHGAVITPRFAYKWTTGETSALRLNGGTGFRVVQLFTEEHAALTGAREVVIAEALQPEKSYNLNLNFQKRLGRPSRQLFVDASVWYTYFKNQIIADYEVHPNQIVYANLDGYALSRGLTLNLEWNIMQRFRGTAGMTLQDVAKYEPAGDHQYKRIRPLLTEQWSGTWSMTYTFPVAGLTADYTGNIYGPMLLPLASPLDPRKKESPVWSIQNIQLTKYISPAVELYGGVKNLLNWTPAKENDFLIARTNDPFDKKVTWNASGEAVATPDNPYALTFDPGYIYAPNQGIRFFLGVRVVIKE